jgi:hypothetical protein
MVGAGADCAVTKAVRRRERNGIFAEGWATLLAPVRVRISG